MLSEGVALIGEDLVIRGEIAKCQVLEVRGYIEGGVRASQVRVHPGGRVYGTVRADSMEVHGHVQGDVAVKNLISIGSTGVVSGKVHYGQLSMAAGGELAADVRNVPPSLSGDFNIVVRRGKSVRITTEDLTALDPDDTADGLLYSVSGIQGGFMAMTATPSAPITSFTQADILKGSVLFVHDGSATDSTRFDVEVSDRAGAKSGKPQTVTVAILE